MQPQLFALAYLDLGPGDRAFIDAYRQDHDQAYVDVVAPHFTLVFGCDEISQDTFCSHVREVAKPFAPIKFVCRYAMLGVDHASPTGHVFLVPDEGYAQISLLHDALYTGPLKQFHRLDIPFTPHIAIGTLPTLQEAKVRCDALNREELEMRGRVTVVTVGALIDNKIVDIEHVPMTA